MMLNAFSKILDWLENLVRILFFLLDKIVYKLIAMVYDLLLDIANANIFDEDFFTLFSSRIYVILGVIMLFKVSFNVISYIISPEEFLDKNKGFGKVITLILISLSLLVVTPWIFNKARDVQTIVLNNNLIERLILGEPGAQGSITPVGEPGDVMAQETFKAFCHGGTYPGGDIDAMMSGIDINEKSGDEYVWEYMYLVSTVVGVCIVLLLIVMCFDVVVRNVKLGFLQMLAPIPIISRMDPKGQGIFDKWVKACTNTYLDLFIRLLGISIAVLVITQLGNGNINLGQNNSLLVKVFIIIGVLLFAKQLPQLIQDLFGVKLDGKFTMNPLKKLGEVPIAGGAMAAGATMAAGGALALGRGGANLLGGGLKKGAGHLLGNQKLISSGDRTLRNTRSAMEKRWNNTRAEARGRFTSAGLMGGEYKGDTAGKMYAKEKESLRNTRLEGQREFSQMHQQWQQGDAIYNDLGGTFDGFDGKNVAAYQIAYKNEEFQNSLKSLDDAEYNSKLFAKEYAKAVAQGSAFTGTTFTLNDGTVKTFGAGDLDKLYEENQKYEKVRAGREKVHDTMRKKYSEDAQTQDAIKTRKNNPTDPTTT